VGASLDGVGIPVNAVIASVTNATTAIMNVNATVTGSPVAITIGPRPVPYHNRAIGVSRDGVAGTDITVPKLEFTITRNFQYVTWQYLLTLRSLTGTVNFGPWYQFNGGELLFLGVSFQVSQGPQQSNIVKMTYRFAAAPNQTNIDLVPDNPETSGDISHLLRIPFKEGWDYLWCAYDQMTDPSTGRMVSRPSAAYVERVYPSGDFTLLGI
jgi:hypothetical protein